MNKRQVLFRLTWLIVLAAFCASGTALVYKTSRARQAGAFYEKLRLRAGEDISSPGLARPSAPTPGAESVLPPLCTQVLLLQADQPDTAAWLQLPGTAIDYPVMLRAGDNAYYLDKLPDGSRNAAGSLFLDCRCTVDSRNLVIYGHNAGEAMFGSLRRYRDEAYYRAHPSFLLATAEREYVLRIFSVRLTDAYGGAYDLSFASAADLSAYCAAALEDSLYPAGDGPSAEDRIVTLSTCTGRARAERLVVQAVLLPADNP